MKSTFESSRSPAGFARRRACTVVGLTTVLIAPTVHAQTVSSTVVAAIVQPKPPPFFHEYIVADPDSQPFPAAFMSGATSIVSTAGGSVAPRLPHLFVIKVAKDPASVVQSIQTLAQSVINKNVETTFNFPVTLTTVAAPPCQINQSCAVADPGAPEYFLGPSNVSWTLGQLQTMPRADDLMTSLGRGTTVALIDTPPIPVEPTAELPPRAAGFDIGPASSSVFQRGHGTQVSTILFGQKNGRYSQGVSPMATRHHYGVSVPDLGSLGNINNASMLLSDVIGLFWFLGQIPNPPDIISMSAGLPFGFTPLRTAIRDLSDKGILMFFASGNETADECLYPGRYNFPNAICVGATGVISGTAIDSFQVAMYSNRGVDIALPGTGIPVPSITQQGVLVRDTNGSLVYTNQDGTSFATPHAAGIASRILSELRANPGRYPQASGLSRAEMAGYVRNLMFTNTTDVEGIGFDTETGYGIPDLEAIYRQMQLDARPSIHALKQTIREWNDPSFYGNPILGPLLARTSGSDPLTKIALNFTFSRGGCARSSGKIEVGKPKLDVDIRNFQASITGMNNDTIDVSASYDLRIPVRIEVKYLLPFVSCILPIPVRITITGDWRSSSTGYTNNLNVQLKLDGEGYRVNDVQVSGPQTKNFFIGYSGIPSIFNQFVNDYDDQLRSFGIPAVQLFEEGVNDHIVQMIERMLNATLSGDRRDPYAYFKARRPEPAGALPLALDYYGSSDRHSHDAAAGSNQSIFELDVTGLAGMQPLTSTADPALGANPADVAQAVETNTYSFMLDYLGSSGVLNTRTNPQVAADLRTATESQPDVQDAVRVRIDNVQLQTPPTLISDRTVAGFFGRVQMIATADVTVDGTTDPIVFIYSPFISEDSTYKEYERESDFTPFPLDLRWEERLVADPFQAAPMNALPVLLTSGFVERPSTVTPTLPILSTAEFEELLRATVLNEYQRALGSVSTKRVGLDARLGAQWGCLGSVVDFVNLYARQLSGRDFIDLRLEQNCWNLNLGVFGPTRTTSTRDLPNHLVHDDTLNPRQAPVNLVPNATTPAVSFMTHPQDSRYQAARVPLSYFTSGTQADFYYSVNGEWMTPPANTTAMDVVEEVWQAVLLRRSGTRFVYAPERMSFAPGEKQDFEMLGAARDARPAQLEVGSCWMRFPIDFAYARLRNTPVGPTSLQAVAALAYEQTRVDSPNDGWTPIQECEGGGVEEPYDAFDD